MVHGEGDDVVAIQKARNFFAQIQTEQVLLHFTQP
jgi:hypothetical protein